MTDDRKTRVADGPPATHDLRYAAAFAIRKSGVPLPTIAHALGGDARVRKAARLVALGARYGLRAGEAAIVAARSARIENLTPKPNAEKDEQA